MVTFATKILLHFFNLKYFFNGTSKDTSDGQDRYFRKCGKGLETGCFIENTENGVSNITNVKIAKYIISLSRDYIQFVYVLRIIATAMIIVTIVME